MKRIDYLLKQGWGNCHRFVQEDYELSGRFIDGYPVELPENKDVLWTPLCGAGWRFGLRRSLRPQAIEFCFDPGTWPADLSIDCLRFSAAVYTANGTHLVGGREVAALQGKEFKSGDPPYLGARTCTFHKPEGPAAAEGGPIVYRFLVSYIGLPLPQTWPHHTEIAAETGEKLIWSTELPTADVTFYLYSRRNSTGSVSRPTPLYANSELLRSNCAYFETLLNPSAGFQRKDTGICSLNEDYSYESDSDLDEAEENLNIEAYEPALQKSLEQLSFLDDDTILAEGELGPVTENTDEGRVPYDSDRVNTTLWVICVKDTAYWTWRALLAYLYTGRIVFAPLTSSGLPRSERQLPSIRGGLDAQVVLEAIPCSPKSVFRLADKLGFKALEDRAFQELQAQVTAKNVFDEYFTSFTSK